MKKRKCLFILVVFAIIINFSITAIAIEKKENVREIKEIVESDEKGIYVIKPEKDETGKYVVKSDEKVFVPYSEFEADTRGDLEPKEENINKVSTTNENQISLMAATPTGCLDVVDANVISGWAWRSDIPNSAIDVHIYIYNDETGKQYGPYPVRADDYREDLKNAGVGNGYHCFNYEINWTLYPPCKYKIIVYAIGENATYNPSLNNCPKFYTVAKPEGSLDVVNNSLISGWTWCSSDPNQPINAFLHIQNVETGGTYVYQILADGYREDLKNAGFGNGYHRFDFVPEWKKYKPGTYKVTLYGSVGQNITELPGSGKTYKIFAFSSGTLSGVDTSNQMNNAYNAYIACGYDTIRLLDPNYYSIKANLNAMVQFYSGHGAENNIQFKESGIWTLLGEYSTSGKRFVSINDITSWKNNTKLVTYMACKTAGNGTQSIDSVSYRTVNDGEAETSIGFLKDIYPESAEDWVYHFSQRLAKGYGVWDSANYANRFIYRYPSIKEFALTYWSDKNVTIVDLNNKSSINNVEEGKNILDRKLVNGEYNNENIIIESIKKYDSKFNIENYSITKTENIQAINVQNSMITKAPQYIDYQLKIGDFYTEAGYTVEIFNNKVVGIYDNNIDLEKQNEYLLIKNQFKMNKEQKKVQYEKEAINKVKSKYSNFSNIKVYDEIDNSYYFFDIKNNKKYLIVTVKNEIKEDGVSSYSIDEIKFEL